MVDTLTIELGFSQQVAAEALKNPPKLSFRCKSRDGSIGAGLSYCDGNQILASREGRENRYVKSEAIDSHILVRTHAIHLRLDSQFNLSDSSSQSASASRMFQAANPPVLMLPI